MFNGSATVYKLMYLVGFSIMMVINLKTFEHYKLNKIKTIILTLITYVAGVSGAMIMGDIYTYVMEANSLPGSTTVAIFGAVIFTPIFMTVASVIIREDWRSVLDMLAPGIFIILACAKFGCFLYGCCHGNECSFGIQYLNSDIKVFPIQIVEVFLMSIIIFICFRYAFKSKHYLKGTVYPVTTIIYCVVRFFVEFFRYYKVEAQRHIMFGITFWQFCCILSIVICIAWILILRSTKCREYYKIVEQKRLDKEEALKQQELVERARKNKDKNKKRKSKKR